jgi:hypothetical protein
VTTGNSSGAAKTHAVNKTAGSQAFKTNNKGKGTASHSDGTTEQKLRQLPNCLNPSCSELHYIADCPRTSSADKKALKQAYFDSKQRSSPDKRETRPSTQAQTVASTVKAMETSWKKVRRTRTVVNNDGHIPATLEDLCFVPAMPDYGADDNVISQQTIRRLFTLGTFVPTQKLDQPIIVQLTAKDMTSIAAEKVQLTLTLQLEAGPLRMRKVQFLVLGADFDEVLLGRPILNTLGIDVAEHLNTVRTEFHEHDFSDVTSLEMGSSGTLARVLFTNAHSTSEPVQADLENESTLAQLHEATFHIVHGNTESFDGITDTPSIPIGTDSAGEVAAALDARIELAVNNGLSPNGKIVLCQLLHEYQDIFALKLGPQPA